MRKIINGEIHYYIVQGDCITECDKETYLLYYREVWRTNYNRMHRQGLCFARSAYLCRGDCAGCRYLKASESHYEPAEEQSVEEMVEKRLLVEAILKRIRNDIENGEVIVRMRSNAYTVAEISETLGITMSMVYRRIKKIQEVATEVAENFEKIS